VIFKVASPVMLSLESRCILTAVLGGGKGPLLIMPPSSRQISWAIAKD